MILCSCFLLCTFKAAFKSRLVLVGCGNIVEVSVSVAPYVQCTQVTDTIQNFYINLTIVHDNVPLM